MIAQRGEFGKTWIVMRDASIVSIIREVRTISPEDTVGRAAEALRASGLTELPVISAGRVVGIVNEASVLGALTGGDPKVVTEQPIHTILSQQVVCVNPYMSVGQVAEVMKDHGLRVLPVIDEYGAYLGVVTRPDITSAFCLTIRPPVVAGMATPLGVYLTTGHLRAGAGDLGLFLTGVALMLMNFAASGIILGTAWLVQRTTEFPLWAILHSPPISVPNWMDTVRGIMLGAAAPLFLLLLRILPLSGYHAAEHQVVHAIERGEPLKPANVVSMPRVHPRCGTNIVAGVILFLMVAQTFSNEIAVLITVFILVFAWRIIGGYFQYYVTTKPPSPKQVESGIRAGESLLEKYRSNPAHRVGGWRRVWYTGMPQIMIGVSATVTVREILHLVLPRLF